VLAQRLPVLAQRLPVLAQRLLVPAQRLPMLAHGCLHDGALPRPPQMREVAVQHGFVDVACRCSHDICGGHCCCAVCLVLRCWPLATCRARSASRADLNVPPVAW